MSTRERGMVLDFLSLLEICLHTFEFLSTTFHACEKQSPTYKNHFNCPLTAKDNVRLLPTCTTQTGTFQISQAWSPVVVTRKFSKSTSTSCIDVQAMPLNTCSVMHTVLWAIPNQTSITGTDLQHPRHTKINYREDTHWRENKKRGKREILATLATVEKR
jgi:hypothetical protein